MKVFLFWLIATASALAYSANDGAKTITSDGTFADTQGAVDYVAAKAQDGWVITVGSASGAYTWTGQLSASISNIATIQGASASNRPTITSTYGGGQGISIACTALKTITLKDFIFAEWSPTNCLVLITGGGLDCFRFTNVKFGSVANPHENGSAAAYIGPPSSGRTDAGPYGLIDHCDILGSGYGFFIRENSVVDSWRRNMTFGTRYAVYIEDCTFGNTLYIPGRQCLDGNNGCRVVFRHNSVLNQTLALHGPDNAGAIGSLQWECMHNTIEVNHGTVDNYTFFRSGTGVIFDNVFTAPPGGGNANEAIKFGHFPASSNSGVTVTEFYPGDYLGGQQPGCGVQEGATGQCPKFPAEPWVSMPMYFWGNTRIGSFGYDLGSGLGGSPYSDNAFFEPGRDYFNDGTQKPGYAEYTYPHPLQGGVPLVLGTTSVSGSGHTASSGSGTTTIAQ